MTATMFQSKAEVFDMGWQLGVALSNDGVNWVTFRFQSNTQYNDQEPITSEQNKAWLKSLSVIPATVRP